MEKYIREISTPCLKSGWILAGVIFYMLMTTISIGAHLSADHIHVRDLFLFSMGLWSLTIHETIAELLNEEARVIGAILFFLSTIILGIVFTLDLIF